MFITKTTYNNSLLTNTLMLCYALLCNMHIRPAHRPRLISSAHLIKFSQLEPVCFLAWTLSQPDFH